jgi:hypothetical protein
MKDNYLIMSKNKMEIIESFAYDCFREDHYSGNNAIYRFSAITRNEKRSNEDVNNIVENLKSKLYETSIIPSRIQLYYDFSIEVEWHANNFQIVTSKKQYLNLALEFANYIDSINIDILKVNSGTLEDDPEELIRTKIIKVNYNPIFNQQCFGHKKIEVLDCRC